MFRGKWMRICSLLCVFFLVVGSVNFPKAQAADPWVNQADVSWIDSSKKLVAFTFDDGPVGTAPTASSQRIMDVLEKYGMHCTYFYWGEKINSSNVDEIKRAYSLGCELGNHSFTHPYLTNMSAAQIKEEIAKTNAWLEPISGNAETLIRPPYGSTNNTVQQAAGAPLINWSLDSGDWNNGNYNSVLRTVRNGIQDGSIILFHETYDYTAQAVETLVPELIEQGYEIVSVSELMKMKGVELKAGTVYTNQAVGKPNVIENVDHEHVYQDIVTAPTCTERGYTTHKCTVEGCKKVVVDTYVDALGHDWDEGKITTPATEESAGLMTYTCARCGETKTKRIPRIGATVPDDIDFKDAASADRFEVVNKTVTEIRAGEGLYMITTKDAFEPCNGQLSGDAATTPKDLVLIPVEGDWQATLKFNFSTGSAGNGYYQFFGFYAMQDYNNCAGIRGGDGAFQNFLRIGGELAADSADMNSSPGFSSAGTYWFRIIKEGTSYACFRSANGEEFTEIFSYVDTGIEADKIAIDAYTGMTEGYVFMVDTLSFEDVGGAPQPHVHDYAAVVTAPTCTKGGYTTFTCSCGDSYVADETDPVAHEFVNGECKYCGLKAFVATFICDEHASVTVYDSQAEDSPKTEKAASAYARNSDTGEIDASGDGQVNFVVAVDDGYELVSVTAEPNNYKNLKLPAETGTGYRITKITGDFTVTVVTKASTCEHDYKAVVTAPTCTEKGYTTYTCSKCGISYVDEITEKLQHNFVNGACTVCGLKAYVINFACDAGASVTVYESQAEDSPKVEKAAATYARSGDTGEIDASGDGQVNFEVVLAPGYVLKDVTAEPKNYKNIKLPEETGAGYRITKISGDFTVTVTTEKGADYVCDGGEACPSKGFTDVPMAGTWAHAGIDYCVETGLMKGISDGIFNPSGTVTRGQLVTILYRIAGEPAFTTDKQFSDVEDGRYYTKAVLWAAENGIVTGYSDGTFLPNREISREQIAAILYRYEGSPAIDGKLEFPDAATAGAYAENALIWATQKGLITGVKTTGATLLNPKANAPRAQIATIIMRFSQLG